MTALLYREGYKYQLAEDWSCQTGIRDQAASLVPWVHLDSEGVLVVRASYCWDGASGPTWDQPRSAVIPASLAHDALYQLMRERKLPQECRARADELFYELLRKGGMGRVRAWIWYRAVRRCAGFAARPGKSEALKA